MKKVTKYEAELIQFKNNWSGMRPWYNLNNKLTLPFGTLQEALDAKKEANLLIDAKGLELEAIVLRNSNGIFLIIKYKAR